MYLSGTTEWSRADPSLNLEKAKNLRLIVGGDKQPPNHSEMIESSLTEVAQDLNNLEVDTTPVDASANSGDDHVLLLIDQRMDSKTILISTNPEDHDEFCRYRMWSGPQRAHLLSETTKGVIELREFMEKSVTQSLRNKGILKRGKSEEEWKAQVKCNVDQAMSSQVVLDYLKSQREMYDGFKETMLRACECTSAKMIG